MLRLAQTQAELDRVRALLREYAGELDFSLCFQNFSQELESLPGNYAAPSGRLWLEEQDGETHACVALRPWPIGVLPTQDCEMKRLFVRPLWRGRGLGRMLAEAAIREAGQIGYRRMLLDTIRGKMDSAIRIYRDLGFIETAAYTPNPHPDVVYFSRELP